MLAVYKYKLSGDDYFEIDLPEDAKILTVQTQYGTPCLWALVDPDNKMVTRRFRMAGTGHTITEKKSDLFYHGTFQLLNGSIIFHLFEIPKL